MEDGHRALSIEHRVKLVADSSWLIAKKLTELIRLIELNKLREVIKSDIVHIT